MQNSHRFDRTFGIEEQLPRVPLPRLEDSCARFLEWSAPLLTQDELTRTRDEVEQFLTGPGPALHAALLEYDESGPASWLDRFWKARYLGTRARIALNWNFFFLFSDSGETQLDRAAGLIASALNYKQYLDAEIVPPAILRGSPQSMVQHKYLFGTTRIPGFEQDTARTPYSDQEPGPARARHIVVFYRNGLYRMDVIGKGGEPYPFENLKAGLRLVMEQASLPVEHDMALGALTSKARAEWAASREAFRELDTANAEALDVIESALFCLCLEDFAPADTRAACDQLLHGDSGNRWFDKAVSLIVFADGRAGVNFEHCQLDGITTVAFVDALLGTAAQEPGQPFAIAQGLPLVQRIEFVLDEALQEDVREARAAFKDYAAGVSTELVSLAGFGSKRIKSLGMSPDAFVQLAFQLAHYRSRGLLGSTYESVATRHWRHGRTEAMRVVTPQCLRFVKVMADAGADVTVRGKAFRAAAEAHVARTKQCQAGDAPEQHLAELQLIHIRRGGDAGDLPIFRSPGWLIMRDAYMSTSSALSENIQYFGFGPTGINNIGVPYVLLPEGLNIYLSAQRPAVAQMHTFAERLIEAVRELENLLAT